MKILLIIEQCNPDWASVPLVGYNFYYQISQIVDITLVTHERNRTALEKCHPQAKIVYISESKLAQKYYQLIQFILGKKGTNWPLLHTLSYPIYEEFNQKVYQQFKQPILRGDYDLVHAITPMMPRYPFKIVKLCQKTPFMLGPVNGGVPFPPGFEATARKENANLNFLRSLGRILIPGYKETYQKAQQILAGSTYTLNMLKDAFNIRDDRITLFYENGISENFLKDPQTEQTKKTKIKLLFVGRLVPYKCADVVIESLSKLPLNLQNQLQLTIVGDGSEKTNLENLVKQLNLQEIVNFTGWVDQQQTLEYYRQADIFCFPSIREFGGAVVMEAMACGLPCIVVNNGGIGEYVTEETGFKIEPISREYLIKEVTDKIKILTENQALRQKLSLNAIARAREFTWRNKAHKIVEFYQRILNS